MEDLIIYNVKLNQEEDELFLILLNLGLGAYLEELTFEFTGNRKKDKDFVKAVLFEIQDLLQKFNLDLSVKIERNIL